jgi:hypothetical protein
MTPLAPLMTPFSSASPRASVTPGLRFHDLRGTHETLPLDASVPIHVVAARCGHDPAVMLRAYAKRTRKADTSAAVIGSLSGACWVNRGRRAWTQLSTQRARYCAGSGVITANSP